MTMLAHQISDPTPRSHPVRLKMFLDERRLFILDDMPLIAESIQSLFSKASDATSVVEITTVAGLSAETIRADDLVLISFGMAGMTDVSDLISFRSLHPKVRFAVISAQTDHYLASATMRLGGIGFVPKTLAPNVFYHAIRMMIEGGHFIPDFLLNASVSNAHVPDVPFAQGGLTKRQVEVLRLLVLGMSNKTIGRELGICEATVKLHVQRAYRSLGVRNRIGAIRKMMQRSPLEEISQDR